MSTQYKQNDISSLPFRRGIGIMIVNSHKEVFIGKRSRADSFWQMPQGGLHNGELPSTAAFREMKEEIGSSKGVILAETRNWYSYRIPVALIPRLWDGRYCGQRQKWFLIQFTGVDSDINIKTHHQEFQEWKWVHCDDLMTYGLPFKLKLYSSVIQEFKTLLQLNID